MHIIINFLFETKIDLRFTNSICFYDVNKKAAAKQSL